MPVDLVIFDLDDTLSDHHNSVVSGIEALRQRYAPLKAMPTDALVDLYQRQLEVFHRAILAGTETAVSARPKRYRAFLGEAGVSGDPDTVDAAIARYQEGYRTGRRAVPGAAAVLQAIQARGLPVAVLTNHYSEAEQRQKLADCGLERLVDALFVSAAIGSTKPDQQAFATVLEAFGAEPSAAVMVGDSLQSDVQGALDAGLQAVWLNRHGAPVPPQLAARVLTSFEQPAEAAAIIAAADPGTMGERGQ